MKRRPKPPEFCPSITRPAVMVVGDPVPTQWRERFCGEAWTVIEAKSVQEACTVVALATPWISVIPGQIGGIDATELWRRMRSIRTQHYMPIVCVVAADLNSNDGDPSDPNAVFDVVFHLDRGVTALTAEVMRLIRLAGEVRGHPGFGRKPTRDYPAPSLDIDRLPKGPPKGEST